MANAQKYLNPLLKELKKISLSCILDEKNLQVSSPDRSITIYVGNEQKELAKDVLNIPLDYIISQPKKIAAIILSKLNLNKTIFARNCNIEKISKQTAEDFFDTWHFFGSTSSAYNYGIIYKGELIGAASFSKGRKMNRLPSGKQSFELIRFCCKSGITVTGGLSKLMSHFCAEKNAGDIMTYVDKQFSNGDSFIKAGFKVHSQTPPLYFLVNKKTHKRTLLKNDLDVFDENLFFKTQNSGNLKMTYTPHVK